MSHKLGFIGCGNMGGALIRSAASKKSGDSIFITDALKEKAQKLSEETGAEATDIETIAASCEYIFLGVKPQNLKDTTASIKQVLADRTDRFIIVTMAAGTGISTIKGYLGNYPVIRIMPNLAVSVGEGMTLYCTEDVTDAETEAFLDIMENAGRFLAVTEKLVDAGSCISGCGPAYAFMFIEALADGGVALGLPRKDAQLMASQMLLGSAKLLQESGRHPGELKDAVCSPGGTTIEGVRALEDGAFRSDVIAAVLAAYDRTMELKCVN